MAAELTNTIEGVHYRWDGEHWVLDNNPPKTKRITRKVVNCAKCGRRLLAADRKAKKCLHCGAFYNVD
jgi:hypothetical protein